MPVFAVNFGEIGFLATVDRDEAERGLRARASRATSRCWRCPAIEARRAARASWLAINDVSMHRQPGKRVADLAYAVGGDEVGRVRCDGLVVATPAGSTGYNLANGGPVMAWGVEGFVVSFIAPHSLTARALVVAPDDVLAVHNRSREEPVDVTVDGRPVCAARARREEIEARFVDDQGVPGADRRLDLLPAPAGEVRPAGHRRLTTASRPRSVGAGWYTVVDAARAARREPAADGAGRAPAGARA